MSSFFKEIGMWLISLNLLWWQGLIFFSIFLISILLLNYNKTRPIWEWLVGLFSFKKKRNIDCKDCITIIIGHREKLESKRKEKFYQIELLENSVLKSQMNFVEQKIIDLESMFINFYNERIRLSKNKLIYGNETIQYRMFWGMVRDAFEVKFKDQIRKSFKENGFYNISGNEFAAFVKDKHKATISMFTQHIINLYPSPSTDMIVSMEDVLTFIDNINPKFEDRIFEIYIEAKKIKKNVDDKINEVIEKFDKYEEDFCYHIDNIIMERKTN